MTNTKSIEIRDVIKFGLLAGVITLSLSVIGFIDLLGTRELIAGMFTLGHVFMLAAPFGIAFISANKVLADEKNKALGYGFLIGVIASLPLVVLAVLATSFDIRQFLPNVSPSLIELLTFGQGLVVLCLTAFDILSSMV